MTRKLCAALLVLSGSVASVARAADDMPAPTESAPPAGGMPAPTESAPPPVPGAAGPVVGAGELSEETPLLRQADLSYGVAARLRWISVPGWLLNAFTKKNVPLSSWGTGIEFFRRKANFDLVLSFNYQNMSPPDGNWLGKGDAHPANLDTDYVQFNGLALWGVDLSFVWHAPINEWFGLHFGAGIGVAYVAGEILRTSNDPNACNEMNAGDIRVCKPIGSTYNPTTNTLTLSPQSLTRGPDEPSNPHRFSDPNVPPALPIVNLLVGVDFRLPQVRGWEARIEGGFYDAFFLGGAVGYTF